MTTKTNYEVKIIYGYESRYEPKIIPCKMIAVKMTGTMLTDRYGRPVELGHLIGDVFRPGVKKETTGNTTSWLGADWAVTEVPDLCQCAREPHEGEVFPRLRLFDLDTKQYVVFELRGDEIVQHFED